ncbi:MAG: hypothetical protein P9L97_06570 [Candidatus Tenebribacter davisii]|nr:hypothetical protein [Candidatus Tenebribacter davisii]
MNILITKRVIITALQVVLLLKEGVDLIEKVNSGRFDEVSFSSKELQDG